MLGEAPFWGYRRLWDEGSWDGHHPMVGVCSPETLRGVRGPGKWGISIYGSSVRGTWRGGSFTRGPEGYERKAPAMGVSLYGSSAGQPGVGSSTRDFQLW